MAVLSINLYLHTDFMTLYNTPFIVDVKKLQDTALMSVIPEYFLPFAKFKITQCSTFGIICRLKSNDFTITSEGKVLSLPEFPLFSVSVPENAIKRGEQLRFIVKVSFILVSTIPHFGDERSK